MTAVPDRASLMELQQLTCPLGADRCDIENPALPGTRCALRVGHGSRHECWTLDGEVRAWG